MIGDFPIGIGAGPNILKRMSCQSAIYSNYFWYIYGLSLQLGLDLEGEML